MFKLLAALGTVHDGAALLYWERLTAAALPTNERDGVATYYRKVWDMAIYDGSRLNEGITANRKSGADGRVGAYFGAVLYKGWADFRDARGVGFHQPVFSKDSRWATVDVGFQNDATVEHRVVHDFDVVGDEDPRRDCHIVTDQAIVANDGVGHYMGKRHDAGVGPNAAGRVDVGRLVNQRRVGLVILKCIVKGRPHSDVYALHSLLLIV